MVSLAGSTKALESAGLVESFGLRMEQKSPKSWILRSGVLEGVLAVVGTTVVVVVTVALLLSYLLGPLGLVIVPLLVFLPGMFFMYFDERGMLWLRPHFDQNLRFTAATMNIDPPEATGAGVLRGRIRALRGAPAAFPGTDRGLIAASLVVGRSAGGTACYFRAEHSAEFLLELDDGETKLVSGALRLRSRPDRVLSNAQEVHATLGALGIPGHGVPSAVVEEQLLRDGDEVEVHGGTSRVEARAVLAGFYREGGMVQTIHGSAGTPVVLRRVSRTEG